MKELKSLLKGKKLKNSINKNSLFFIKKIKENKEVNNTENNYFPKNNNILLSRRNSNIFKSKKKVNEDYEDLFLHFLKTPEKIDMFEPLSEKSKKTKNIYPQIKHSGSKFEEDEEEQYLNENKTAKKEINIKKIFYQELYLNLIDNKLKWNNFFFSKGVYNIMYQKSRIKQKQILKFSLKYNKKCETIIKSYEKIYTSLICKHNWNLSPKIAYDNYYKIYLKKYLAQNKDNNNKNLNSNYSDVVIKADNNGQGKTLMFIGKLFNVYIDDNYKNNKKEDHIISMDIKEQKSRKEVIYTYSELMAKSKMKLKPNYSYNTRLSSNKLENKESKEILIKKLKQNNNFNFIINSLRNNNNSFEKGHVLEIKNFRRFNTESSANSKIKKNKNYFSFNSIFINTNENISNNNKKDYSLTDKIKNKSKIYSDNKYNSQKQITSTEPTQSGLSFSPNYYKPFFKKENDNNKNKPLYSKLILNKKIQTPKLEKNKKEKLVLNFFKNNSDFYY